MRYVLSMFRDLSLAEVFKRVADTDEWREFCQIEFDGDVETWVWVFSLRDSSEPPCARERAVLRYRELQAKFANSVRQKLISGEWIADGFNPEFGARPVQIMPRLWRVLEFTLGEDRAEGGGYSFINLCFSEARPSDVSVSHSNRPHLRGELIRWIEAQAQAAPEPMTAREVFDAARRAFNGTTISKTLFGEAWRAANKPEHFRQRGRPKAKVAGI